MRDLDTKVQEIMHEAQVKTSQLMQQANDMPKEERMLEIRSIQNLFNKGKELSNDKVSRAENVYELVDKQIRRLDADMFEFKKALGLCAISIIYLFVSAEKELKKSKKKSDTLWSVK